MSIMFHFVEEPDWPALAWLADCSVEADAVEVHHGPGVEVRREWFGEIVWDADFAAADFDRTDTVFGSGGRLRRDRVTFVSSGTTMDRLHSAELRQHSFVSNSLACLCALIGARVDRTYNGYVRDFETIIRGLGEYKRAVSTTAGDVHLTYYDNLVWSGRRLSVVAKPAPDRRFPNFEDYRAFLGEEVRSLTMNAVSPQRTHPFGLTGTISSGYDSAASACIAREYGLSRVFSIDRARDGRRDSGEEVAAALGLECEIVDADAWKYGVLPEVPFISADGKGGDVFLAGAGSLLRNSVVFGGDVGGVVWSKVTPARPGNELARKDHSGLSRAEYRLEQGFIACSVPTIGVRQITDIVAITRSADMEPWETGGKYSRPIPRRVLETAGVPRAAFGSEKKAGEIHLARRSSFLSDASRRDYGEWLSAHQAEWIRQSRIPPELRARIRLPLQSAALAAARALDRSPSNRGGRNRLIRRLRGYGTMQELAVHLFPWALEHQIGKYTRTRNLSPEHAAMASEATPTH